MKYVQKQAGKRAGRKRKKSTHKHTKAAVRLRRVSRVVPCLSLVCVVNRSESNADAPGTKRADVTSCDAYCNPPPPAAAKIYFEYEARNTRDTS